MKKDNKGFTLIELLAVIVVLAIIMVIATTQVNKAMKGARKDSFVQSAKVVVKETKNRLVTSGVSSTDDYGVCASGQGENCTAKYELSETDFTLNITKYTTSGEYYWVRLGARDGGKFTSVSFSSETDTGICGKNVTCRNANTNEKINDVAVKVVMEVYLDANGNVIEMN